MSAMVTRKFWYSCSTLRICWCVLGCLRLDSLKHVVIDWSYRDMKQRRIIDMCETRTDLMDLLCSYVIPHVKTVNSAKLALY